MLGIQNPHRSQYPLSNDPIDQNVHIVLTLTDFCLESDDHVFIFLASDDSRPLIDII